MVNAIITAIFNLIAKLGDLIMSPLITGITALIPSFGTFINSITYYLGRGIANIVWVFKLLCVPKACLDMVVLVATATISITIVVRTYTLIIKIYNKFKL